MLTEVGMGELRDVPRAGPVRKRLLERALDFERRFLATAIDDTSSRRRIALAHHRVGYISEELGDAAAARSAHEAAIRVLADMVRAEPGRADLQAELAAFRCDLGLHLWRGGEDEAANAVLLPAIESLQRLIGGDSPAVRRSNLGKALGTVANVHHRAKRYDEALAYRRRATAAARAAAQANENAGAQETVGMALVNEGNTLRELRRNDEAAQAYDEAIRTLEAAVAAEPGNRRHRNTLARACNSASLLLRQIGDAAGADARLERAIEIRRSLVRDFPEYPELHSELGGNLHNLGNAVLQADPARARALFEEAEELQRHALAQTPDHAEYRSYLSYHRASLCQALLALKRHREAAACAERLGSTPDGGVPKHYAAMYLARCPGLAEADPALDAAARTATSEDYERRSVDLLRRAIESGLDDARVLELAEFSSLRQREDFQRLTASIRR
jgi:tetratricopeptide (TPR) repeat protein